jgi:hypothetical protein
MTTHLINKTPRHGRSTYRVIYIQVRPTLSNFDTVQGWAVSFKAHISLPPEGMSPQYRLERRLDEPHSRSEHRSEVRNFRPLSEIRTMFSDFPFRSLAILSTTLPSSEAVTRIFPFDKEIYKKVSLFVNTDFYWGIRHACSELGSLSTKLPLIIRQFGCNCHLKYLAARSLPVLRLSQECPL